MKLKQFIPFTLAVLMVCMSMIAPVSAAKGNNGNNGNNGNGNGTYGDSANPNNNGNGHTGNNGHKNGSISGTIDYNKPAPENGMIIVDILTEENHPAEVVEDMQSGNDLLTREDIIWNVPDDEQNPEDYQLLTGYASVKDQRTPEEIENNPATDENPIPVIITLTENLPSTVKKVNIVYYRYDIDAWEVIPAEILADGRIRAYFHNLTDETPFTLLYVAEDDYAPIPGEDEDDGDDGVTDGDASDSSDAPGEHIAGIGPGSDSTTGNGADADESGNGADADADVSKPAYSGQKAPKTGTTDSAPFAAAALALMCVGAFAVVKARKAE